MTYYFLYVKFKSTDIHVFRKKKGDVSIRIVLISHGNLAKELYMTAKMILGDVANLTYLDYPAGQDLDLYKENLGKIVHDEKEVLILADLFSGSPFMQASKVFAENNFSETIELFAGVNLPMILEISILAKTMALKDLRKKVVEIGKTGIIDFRDEAKKMRGDI